MKKQIPEESVRAALEFAVRSGGWVVPGQPRPCAVEQPPNIPVEEEDDLFEGRDHDLSLALIREELGDCTRCRLSEERNSIVFGVGDPAAKLMFVGEGPGREEDLKGEPFIGNAGRLLDRMIGAIGLARKEVYIANVVKCRPPSNRDPRPDEVETCIPFLWRQIDAIKPRVIMALGGHAAKNLLSTETPISRLRGRSVTTRGWKIVATFHPAYLLRNPSAKRQAWEDLKLARNILEGRA